MKITLESTSKIITYECSKGGKVPVRIWEGKTEAGVEVVAFIAHVAVHKDADASEFNESLQESKPPVHPLSLGMDFRYFID